MRIRVSYAAKSLCPAVIDDVVVDGYFLIMVKRSQIKAFVDSLTEHFKPNQVVLFGSYAYGKPTDDSDVDLLVIMPHSGHSVEQAAKIRTQIKAGFAMDLIVRSPEELERRLGMGDVFMQEIIQKGVPLYVASRA
jgi:predicted nucleotidyltransferase